MELTGATCLKARLRHTLKGTEMLTHIGDFIADMYAVVTRQERVIKQQNIIAVPNVEHIKLNSLAQQK
jgi:hypothetical protein